MKNCRYCKHNKICKTRINIDKELNNSYVVLRSEDSKLSDIFTILAECCNEYKSS